MESKGVLFKFEGITKLGGVILTNRTQEEFLKKKRKMKKIG